jgi:hypothetical protein
LVLNTHFLSNMHRFKVKLVFQVVHYGGVLISSARDVSDRK